MPIVVYKFENNKNNSMSRDETVKNNYKKLCLKLSEQFLEGEEIDLDAILFLIGVQELGVGKKRFKKDEKVNLMHVALCRLLEPYGYYKFSHFDADKWPHYDLVNELPMLKPGEQSVLVKEAIVQYFIEKNYI